jgi:hypothetical protein
MPTASYSVRYLASPTSLCCPFVLQFLYSIRVVRRPLTLAHGMMAFRREPYSAESLFLPELMDLDDDDELPSPTSTEWHREHGKRKRREKAAK